MFHFVFFLSLGVCSWAAGSMTDGSSPLCQEAPPCPGQQGGCYTTCHNQCGCEGDEEGRLVNPVYGGKCRETGFCEESFPGKEECIEDGGESCPQMISMDQVLRDFSKFDFRIDVRSDGEWEAGHANMSIHVPGLAAMDTTYMHRILGKEKSNVLVYCRSGTRAFHASMALLKFGFESVNSFYDGGLPSLSMAIRQRSYQLRSHPTKNFCYLTGSSDICPQPLPLSHIHSSDDIMGLGDKIVLVDVRPVARYPDAIPGAVRMYTDRMRPDDVIVNLSGDETLVTYCMKGTLAFRGAKALRDAGWIGELYFIDNGGYPELQEQF